MKTFFLLCAYSLLPLLYGHAKPASGFSLPDSLQEFTLTYRSLDHLIILPVRINGTLDVNLILDTGCRNVVLFGKKFHEKLDILPNKIIEFSGMGNGKGVTGTLSLNNQVSIGAVTGTMVPIIVVPSDHLFQHHENIDGLIGYDIFTRFEVEISPEKQLITFRPCTHSYVPPGYTKINFDVNDSKPAIPSSIMLDQEELPFQLIIDTGSTLGLLIKSTDNIRHGPKKTSHTLGRGVNGVIRGIRTQSKKLQLPSYLLENIDTGIIYSPWHQYASLGMGVLKDYSIILNYAQSYMCLKKIV